MSVNHAGTGVPHHSPNLLPHNGLVAMHRTLGARRFILLEWTFVEALPGITQKLAALEAKFISGSMLSTTIDVDHSLNGLVFSCYSRMVVRHDECLLQALSTWPPPNGNETSRPSSPLQHPGQPVRCPVRDRLSVNRFTLALPAPGWDWGLGAPLYSGEQSELLHPGRYCWIG
jgi:hypothetical protein